MKNQLTMNLNEEVEAVFAVTFYWRAISGSLGAIGTILANNQDVASNTWQYFTSRIATDNTQYVLCTALCYFGFKPAANTTALTVDPRSTLLLTANKTAEQLQQEARNI